MPVPSWPGSVEWPGTDVKTGKPTVRTEPLNRTVLEEFYRPWIAIKEQGVGVHCGECGCWNKTPHAVFLAWFGDVVVGHGFWAAVGPDTAELALVVADRAQGRGVGRALTTAALGDATAAGMRQLELVVERDNRVVANLVARRWPHRRHRLRDAARRSLPRAESSAAPDPAGPSPSAPRRRRRSQRLAARAGCATAGGCGQRPRTRPERDRRRRSPHAHPCPSPRVPEKGGRRSVRL